MEDEDETGGSGLTASKTAEAIGVIIGNLTVVKNDSAALPILAMVFGGVAAESALPQNVFKASSFIRHARKPRTAKYSSLTRLRYLSVDDLRRIR